MKAPILKGEKVILKPLDINEAADYVRWLKDPEVNVFLSKDYRDLDLKKEKEYIKKFNKSKARIEWSIYASDGAHIGGTGLKEIDGKNDLKTVWGIFIGDKNYWGKGYGTDALKIILEYAFNKLKLNRIELIVFPFNKRGIKCYKRCGFKIEGVKKQSVRKNGKFVDDVIMGITKSDYNKFNK